MKFLMRFVTALVITIILYAVESRAEQITLSPDDEKYNQLMNQLWNGQAQFSRIVDMQIQTYPDNGKPFINGMDEGTQIIPFNGVWYLFNRDYDYVPKPPQCQAVSRIVVRKSTDKGKTWTAPVVIATPDLARNECMIGDGYAYWDAETQTWHYLSQSLIRKIDSNGNYNGKWGINHYSRKNSDPMGLFIPDSANQVIKGGDLWSQICGPGKSCQNGTHDEGTPEISLKAQGYYYVTFHGAKPKGPGVVYGYRGIAKTKDFHTWVVAAQDLPKDAIWSSKDCQGWNVPWDPSTGCVGGGHASSLITSKYTYMLIESADKSLNCTADQNWVIGLARAPFFTNSGTWEQFPRNPFMNAANNIKCSIQYPRLFTEAGNIYLSYWTLGPTGFHDPNTYFHIAQLQPVRLS